ncbi:malate oxidoreductase [mine drainage metagenome]|uniref:Malate oxidoreductase n=1 Tax=mine drainage metagenome TaxID=410659 RepID=T1BYB3_9ZZZZ
MQDEERTQRFNDLAVKFSNYYKGKIMVMPKVPIKSLTDFSYWYTPGIAEVSRRISKNPDLSFEMTGRWNSIAILTDGTRVLGIGNVGPEAAMPVMEGKSMIFNFLGGVNAIPIPIRTSSKEEFITVAKALEPSFGGFNLEDIESPKCFYVLNELQKELDIPAWHDDQLGTACIILAGIINSLRLSGKKIEDSRVVFIGSGAANIAAANLLINAGFKSGNLILVDSKGILEPERVDVDSLMINNPWKYELALHTNVDRIKGGIKESMKSADIVVSAAKSDPNTIRPQWITEMNDYPVIFALANPVPEIWPHVAKEGGAKIVATGRGDFPNQINNSLVFPGVFRGILDSRSKGVNFSIMVKASYEIANFVTDLHEDNIVPKMTDWDLFPKVASAVAKASSDEGLARKTGNKEMFYDIAKEIIDENRKIYFSLMNDKLIKELPEE